MEAIKVSIYLAAFILSNFIVLWFGSTGLIFTALFLIPFDFVMRCLFHETWKGYKLIINLGLLVIASSWITLLINSKTINIAFGSMVGFLGAQIIAGIFYQIFIKRSYFLKVNGSDAFAILADSILFQLIAFNFISFKITAAQFFLKIVGGLFWYWIIFVKFKLYKSNEYNK